MFTGRVGSEIGVEGQEAVNTVDRDSQMVGNCLSRDAWNPTIQKLCFLASPENELLRLLIAVGSEIAREDRPQRFKIDLFFGLHEMSQLAASLLLRVLPRRTQSRNPPRSITRRYRVNNA